MRLRQFHAGARTPQLARKHALRSQTARSAPASTSGRRGKQRHDVAWRAVEQHTGSPPALRYFELQMLLDNEAGTVTEVVVSWRNVGASEAVRAGGRTNHA